MKYEKIKDTFNNKGLILLESKYKDEDLHSSFKLECMNKDGYRFLLSYNNLKHFSNKKMFNKSNIFALENIKLLLLKNNANCELVDIEKQKLEYLGTKSETMFRCKICGNVFYKIIRIMIRNSSYCCSKCSIKKRSDSQKINKLKVINLFNDCGYKIVDKNIKNIGTKDKVLVSDKLGYLGYIIYERLNKNNQYHFSVFNIVCNKDNYINNVKTYCKINNIKATPLKLIPNSNIIQFQCRCGNKFESTLNIFRNGKSRCSICAKSKSKYQMKTEDFLKDNNVFFIKEYRFNDCRNTLSLPFDIYIPKQNTIIEVDGEGHYKPSYINSNKSITNLETQKKHDKIKDEYCKRKKINLVRIPYWDFKTEKYKETISNIINS